MSYDNQRYIQESHKIINNAVERCARGEFPNNPNSMKSLIRNIRESLFSTFFKAKNELHQSILDDIKATPDIKDLREIQRLKDEIRDKQNDNEIYTEKIEQLKQIKSDHEYSIFIKYEDKAQRSKKKGIKTNSCEDIIIQRNQNYKKRFIVSLILYIIITAIFAAIDWKVINTAFLVENMGTTQDALFVSILAAFVLDAPPALLGYIESKIESDSILNEMKQKADLISENTIRKKNMGNSTLRNIVRIITIIAVSIYVFSRVLIIFGDSDYSSGFSYLFQIITGKCSFSDLDFESMTFRLSDLITTIIPLATSVCCYAITKFISVNKGSFIKDTSELLKSSLDNEINNIKKLIKNCERDIDNLKDKLNNQKIVIWENYCIDKDMIEDDDEYKKMIVQSYLKGRDEIWYADKYMSECSNIRSNALIYFNRLNEELSTYCTDSNEILNYKLENEDVENLNNLSAESPIPNGYTTSMHLNEINESIINKFYK